MKPSIILAALAATIAAMPAQAQPVAADLLPAYEVTTIIASMGMRPVGRPAWLRGRYVVAAIDRHGREVNVVLDARDGRVLAVRPLGRNSFGPPPPGYARGAPAPYDPMDGAAPPPDAAPGAPPPPDEGEFFDNDRQQGALPPRAPAHAAPAPRDPAVTGSTRNAPVERKDAAVKDRTRKQATPIPRPRPALATANDPGRTPAQSAGTPSPDERKPEAAKPEAKPASDAEAAKPEQAKKPEQADKLEPKKDVRVIDLSKPKTAPKPEDKPGEAIRF